MKKHGLHYFSFLLVFLSMVSLALAEWINLTGAQSAPNIAEIDVEDDHIRLVGRTLSPDRVPIYIEALHRSGIFSGVQFKAVRVEAVDERQQPYRFELSSHRGEEEQ